jgi:hypothetical protein
MFFSRLSAFFTVVVLIGLITLAIIGLTDAVGYSITRGPNTEHLAGTITKMGPGPVFVLKTAAGKLVSFQCTERCISSEPHMQRHLNEHAHTDVYYVRATNSTLIAVNVD